MNDQSDPIHDQTPGSFGRGGISARGWDWRRSLAAGRDGIKDIVAGVVGSIILIGNIVSFGPLMFPGVLNEGSSLAIWSMLIGSCIGGVWIALSTSLSPLASGIDSPTGAVLLLLSAAAGSEVLAAGESPHTAVETVMLIFTAATVTSGALFYGLGARRLGSYLRFVPSCVVAGFLTATGCFLVAGGIRMATGRPLVLHGLISNWSAIDIAKVSCGAAVLGILVALRRWMKWPFAMPAALVVLWLVGAAVLRSFGLSGAQDGWYLRSLGTLNHWSPLEAARESYLTVSMLPRFVPEFFAVTMVALISLVTKVSSLEVARQTSGDLDRELRAHGLANLIIVPLGGITCSLQLGTSRLFDHAGATTRMSAVVCALVLGLVAMLNVNLQALIPIPILAGLVFYLGYSFIVEALWRPFSQRAWLDLLLTFGITLVCLLHGYLIGILAGILCACVLFAMSYARLGVVRRHVTRAVFASYVERSAVEARHLSEIGDAVQLYWLSGYLFFGSSESVFERIRADIEALLPQRVSYVVLDFSMVSGADTSAIVSLTKLRNLCAQHGITIVYCSLSRNDHAALKRAGLVGGKSQHQVFNEINAALAWCEDRLLERANLGVEESLAGFERWLEQQLGPGLRARDLITYLDRADIEGAQICRDGEPADALYLIVSGNLGIDIVNSEGNIVRVKRATTHTVVGEMGFFRRSLRTATVSAEGPTTLFALTRVNFERMRQERPDLASAFTDFIIRVLSDRVDTGNREVAALLSASRL